MTKIQRVLWKAFPIGFAEEPSSKPMGHTTVPPCARGGCVCRRSIYNKP